MPPRSPWVPCYSSMSKMPGSHSPSSPKKLNPAQQKYSAYDRELLAIYEAVKHFRHILEARHFTIFTDHKHITYAFSRSGTNVHRGSSTILTLSPSSRQTSSTFLDMTTLSPTPSLASSPSLRHHHTTHWPHRRKAITSSEHSWGQPPPYGSRNYRSPAPRSPSTATRLLGDLDRMYRVLYGSKYSSPSTICRTRHQSNGETGRAAFCVARRAEGLPHLGACLPVLPALQSLPPYSNSIGRLYLAGSPLSARPRKPGLSPSDVSRLHILPHRS
jgi:hypothetical protein